MSGPTSTKQISSQSRKTPVIAVTMATSRQGVALIRHLSNKGIFKVRAISRDPLNQTSQALASLPNVEVIKGDLLSEKDLFKAFEGVYGIFGNTTPTKPWGMDKSYELKQGLNLINVVKEISNSGELKHFVFSSICKGKNSTSKVEAPGHFLTKWELEKYIYSSNLSEITTILRPASYFENFNSKLPGIKISENFLPGIVSPNTKWQTIAVDDIGLWASTAFHNSRKFKGLSFNLASEELTGNEMARTLQSLKSDKRKRVKYLMIPRNILNLLEHDIAIMANWIEKNGYAANISYLKELAKDCDIRTTSLSNWLLKQVYFSNKQSNLPFDKTKNVLNILNGKTA